MNKYAQMAARPDRVLNQFGNTLTSEPTEWFWGCVSKHVPVTLRLDTSKVLPH